MSVFYSNESAFTFLRGQRGWKSVDHRILLIRQLISDRDENDLKHDASSIILEKKTFHYFVQRHESASCYFSIHRYDVSISFYYNVYVFILNGFTHIDIFGKELNTVNGPS